MTQRFSELHKIKVKLQGNNYKNSKELKCDVYDFMNSYWGTEESLLNDDLYEYDLSELSEFHLQLIEQATQVIKAERSKKNTELISSELSCRSILQKATHGVISNKIYLLNKNSENIVIGDLHSDYNSLKRALDVCDFFNKYFCTKSINLVFAGDYVDRGHTHLKLIEFVLVLKYLFSNNVFLLRGNHDGGVLNNDDSLTLPYRVPKKDKPEMYFPHYLLMLSNKNKSFNKKVLLQYLQLFSILPYVALLLNGNQVVMVVHAGIPRPRYFADDCYDYIKSLADLTDESHIDFLGASICNNLFWSDPYRAERDYTIEKRRFHYTQAEFDCFKNKLDIDLLIRGHESVDDGFRYHFNKSLITIFSSGGVFENQSNPQSNYYWVKPKIVKLHKGEVCFI